MRSAAATSCWAALLDDLEFDLGAVRKIANLVRHITRAAINSAMEIVPKLSRPYCPPSTAGIFRQNTDLQKGVRTTKWPSLPDAPSPNRR